MVIAISILMLICLILTAIVWLWVAFVVFTEVSSSSGFGDGMGTIIFVLLGLFVTAVIWLVYFALN